MSNSVTAGNPGGALDPVASHERAVSRVSKGIMTFYVGWGGMMVVALADGLGLGSSFVQRVGWFGTALLSWIGILVVGSGTPHLVRFGGRRGAFALASFAAAGTLGLVGVAEMFESFFLDSSYLSAWDGWALRAAAGFAVVGGVLLGGIPRKQSVPAQPSES